MISNNSQNNKRIAKNTMMLYIRMLLTMGVALYTSRIVLETLGVIDFGIYNVVGGVVAMFSVISSSLSAAISRFITFELGKKDINKLKKVFSTAISIQIGLAFLVFVMAETIGVWFLNSKINIPIERMEAANWVLQCSILTFMVNLISVPYNAAIIAHEKMSAFAYIGILEVTMKLIVVYLLQLSGYDKLSVYAILLLLVAVFLRLVYGMYCKRTFEECTYHFILDKSLFKEMTVFAGWNFIGASSGVLRDQGVNIALNLFCGPVVNAARGIATQVNTAVLGFVSNFMTAINPQITKSYALGDYKYMMTLVEKGSRLSFYMLLFLSLPILIETHTVLSIWLGNVPDHTVNFVRLILVYAMCESISYTLITAMLATGEIKNYQIVVGGLQMLNFPISYLLLRFGFTPESTMITAICLALCCFVSRLYMLRKMIQLSARKFIKNVFLNVIIVSTLSCALPICMLYYMDDGLYRLFVNSFLCVLSTAAIIYYVGCSKQEKVFIDRKVYQLRIRIFK